MVIALRDHVSLIIWPLNEVVFSSWVRLPDKLQVMVKSEFCVNIRCISTKTSLFTEVQI